MAFGVQSWSNTDAPRYNPCPIALSELFVIVNELITIFPSVKGNELFHQTKTKEFDWLSKQ